MNYLLIACSLVTAFLSSCASTGRVAKMEQQLSSFRSAPVNLVVELNSTKGLSKNQIERETKIREEKAPQAILDNYLNDVKPNLSELQRCISESKYREDFNTYEEAEQYLKSIAKATDDVLIFANKMESIDNKHKAIFDRFGLDVYFAFQTKDENIRIGEGFRKIIYLSDQLTKEYIAQSQPAIVNSPYYFNPNLVAVRPYIRKDGTFVQSHIRTAPNAFKSDNLQKR